MAYGFVTQLLCVWDCCPCIWFAF